jgi:hypothetical protein
VLLRGVEAPRNGPSKGTSAGVRIVRQQVNEIGLTRLELQLTTSSAPIRLHGSATGRLSSHDSGEDFLLSDTRSGAQMALAPREMPTPLAERELHQRLLNGDPTAPADLAADFLDHLIECVRLCNRTVHEHLCIQAAEDAIIALIKNPDSYQPIDGKSLYSYLQMSAKGDLLNILQKEKRHSARTIPLDAVADSPEAGNSLGRDDDPGYRIELHEEARWAEDEILSNVRVGLSAEELEALQLILDGERKTVSYAAALRIDHLPQNEQQAAVKRFKDMISNRIKRRRSDNDGPS